MMIYSPHSMWVTLTRHHGFVGAARNVGRRVERRSGALTPAQPIGAACGLWVILQVSVKRV